MGLIGDTDSNSCESATGCFGINIQSKTPTTVSCGLYEKERPQSVRRTLKYVFANNRDDSISGCSSWRLARDAPCRQVMSITLKNGEIETLSAGLFDDVVLNSITVVG